MMMIIINILYLFYFKRSTDLTKKVLWSKYRQRKTCKIILIMINKQLNEKKNRKIKFSKIDFELCSLREHKSTAKTGKG